jgi:hypothetical protein
MDNISETSNKVITECGHCFHTSCLMTNISHNGFGCPYCRTQMAEESTSEDDSEAYDEEEEVENMLLRGMRWLFQRANGETITYNGFDEDEEDEYEEEEVEEESVPKPSVQFLTQKLIRQGVTMEQLVKTLLLQHDEYYDHDEEFEHVSDQLFGKIRVVLSNFKPDDEIIHNSNNREMTGYMGDRFLRIV